MSCLSSKQKKDYTDAFRRFDRDGSGAIDIKELAHACRDLGFEMSNDEVIEMMRAVDKDGNGKITLDEFISNMERKPAREREEAEWKQAFNRFDLDGSGQISRDEMAKVLTAMGIDGSCADGLISKADKSGDGQISLKEFKAALKEK